MIAAAGVWCVCVEAIHFLEIVVTGCGWDL